MKDKITIFTGQANPVLAREISSYCQVPMGRAKVTTFADGECQVKIQENVRGTDCFVIQPTCPPVNNNLMELLTMTDALFRSSARRITAVMPYYGYARQDRKAEPRVPITAKLVANLIVAAGVNRVLVMDLHAGQIQGFFDIPVDHLYSTPVFLEYLKRRVKGAKVIVAPDAGGVERARAFAKRLRTSLAIVDKRRPRPNHASVMNIVGDVKGKSAIILDDIVDTGNTLVRVARALKARGAREVITACAHGVLSQGATERIQDSPIEELVITNSIPLNRQKPLAKCKVLSVAHLLGEAIIRIHRESSVSSLFV